jgi:FkbM family methyltransferase
MTRSEFYLTGAKNLGLLSLLHFEIQRRRSHSAPFKLTSKMLAFPVKSRPQTSDIGVFTQIFFFDEYRCLSGLRDPKLILDLGANVGYSSAYFLSRFKDCSVIAVEPDPANFIELQKNVAPYRSRVKTFQAAVWPHSGQMELEHPGKGEEWGVRVKPSVDGKVRAISIPELLTFSSQDRISLLKVDIEGSEIDLFQSGYEEWLCKVDNIVIELHGEEAHRIFYNAIAQSNFLISTCDELTVCLSQ